MLAFRPVITQQTNPQRKQLGTQQKVLGATFASTNTSTVEQRLRIGWRIILTLLLLLLVFVLNLLAGSYSKVDAAPLASNTSAPRYAPQYVPQLQSSSDPLVLASYYTWFDQNTWTYDKLSDLPAEQYVSADRAAMGRHIEQAKQAGIDAFVVAWYGPNNNQTEPNLAALLEEAAARNFKIAILFETNSPFMDGLGGVTAALQHANATHINHPAYLRVDNRPVTFFWKPTIYGLGTWSNVRGQVDPNRNSIWISEGVDTSYLSVFDGHHLYSNTWNLPADLGAINQKFARLVEQARQSFGGKFWVSTVMPGYDDTRIRGNGFAKGREGGAYFERSWQAAINSTPNWIIITSFNEWPEGSYIEPSAAHGDRYIQLSAAWSQRFKAGGGQAVPAPVQVPSVQAATQPPPVPAISYDIGATVLVDVPLLNLRSQPNTGATILTELPQNTQLTVTNSQPQWLQVDVSGQSGWIYATMVRPSNSTDGSTASGTGGASTGLATAPASPTIEESPAEAAALSGKTASDAPIPNASSGTNIAGRFATVDVGLLNVREAPSTTAPVLRILGQGATFPIVESSDIGEWVQLRLGAEVGWVYASMITVGNTQ